MIRRLVSPISIGLVLGLLACVTIAAVLLRAGTDDRAGRTPVGLRLLVIDELSDLDDLLTEFTEATGIAVEVDHVRAADLAATVSRPDFAGTYDAVWVAENDTRNLPAVVDGALENGTTVMSSPLVLGLRAGTVTRLGGSGPGLDWGQLAASGPGRGITFGMVTPTADDDTGAALLTIATGLAGAPAAITPQEVYRVGPQLRALRKRQTLTGTSYRDLTEQFSRSEGVDGILTLESEVLRINAAGPPERPALTVVAPQGRAVFARYQVRPVVTAKRRPGAAQLRRLTDYLTAPQAQAWIAQHTYRRPTVLNASTQVGGFSQIHPTPVPRSPGLLKDLSGIYLDTFHYPTRSVFVLDISGSMRGNGIRSLRKAFHSLDPTVATERRVDAEILVIPFATGPRSTRAVTITPGDPRRGLSQVARIVDRLQPGGGTAIYAALEQADREIAARNRLRIDQEQVTSIFLITDGANTDGPGLAQFRRSRQTRERTLCSTRSIEQCRVPVHPVLVGDADLKQMKALAAMTGGRVHDARKVDLGQVLRDLTAGR